MTTTSPRPLQRGRVTRASRDRVATPDRLLIPLIAIVILALSSCSVLPMKKRPVARPPRPAAPAEEKATMLLATGTSAASAETARAAAALALQTLLADTLAASLDMTRTRLRAGDEFSTAALARSETGATVLQAWPALAPGLKTVADHYDSLHSVAAWSSRVRLRVPHTDRDIMLRETRSRIDSKLARLSDLADSTDFVVEGTSFTRALDALDGLFARGCTEWLIPPADVAHIVARRLDALARRVRIRIAGGYFEDCLYFLNVRAEDATGRGLSGVPLRAQVPPGTAEITEPSLPTNTHGDVVFTLEPRIADSLTISLELFRDEFMRRAATSREAMSALSSTLGGRLSQARGTHAIDMSQYESVTWNVELLPRWSRRWGLFGSTLELLGLKGVMSIKSDAPFRRRFAVRCTRVVVGDKEWIPAGEEFLLASFRISNSGPQVRNLATIRLAEFVSDAIRKSGGKPAGPIKLRLSLKAGTACSWPAREIEQWIEIPLLANDGRGRSGRR